MKMAKMMISDEDEDEDVTGDTFSSCKVVFKVSPDNLTERVVKISPAYTPHHHHN